MIVRGISDRQLERRGPRSGDPSCEACKGVGHRAYAPEEAGWAPDKDGAWIVPKTENGPRAIYRFKAGVPQTVLRPCECVGA